MKYLKYAFLFLIATTFTSCANLTTDTKPSEEHKGKPQVSLPLPLDSFVRYETYAINPFTGQPKLVSVGSGAVVKTNALGSFVLTAEHVCSTINDLRKNLVGHLPLQAESAVQGRDGTRRIAYAIKVDKHLDLCLAFVPDFHRPAVVLAAEAPEIADTVYSISAPRGFFGPETSMIPIMKGLYTGRMAVKLQGKPVVWDTYTLRIAPGSSGGMLVNEKGELIGMTHRLLSVFDEISFGTTYEDLRNFLDWVK